MFRLEAHQPEMALRSEQWYWLEECQQVALFHWRIQLATCWHLPLPPMISDAKGLLEMVQDQATHAVIFSAQFVAVQDLESPSCLVLSPAQDQKNVGLLEGISSNQNCCCMNEDI